MISLNFQALAITRIHPNTKIESAIPFFGQESSCLKISKHSWVMMVLFTHLLIFGSDTVKNRVTDTEMQFFEDSSTSQIILINNSVLSKKKSAAGV